MNERKAHALPVVVDMSHNREKNRLLSAENAKPFLEAVGILTKDGRIKADMQRKYTQINEFLRLLDETDSFKEFEGKPLHVVDFGCGNAYLTFAVYYYLHEVLKLDAHVTGVDIKADRIDRHQEKPEGLAGVNLPSKLVLLVTLCPNPRRMLLWRSMLVTPLQMTLSQKESAGRAN